MTIPCAFRRVTESRPPVWGSRPLGRILPFNHNPCKFGAFRRKPKDTPRKFPRHIPSSSLYLSSWQPMSALRLFPTEKRKVHREVKSDVALYPCLDYNSLGNLDNGQEYKLARLFQPLTRRHWRTDTSVWRWGVGTPGLA